MACVRGHAGLVGALLAARASPDAGRTLPADGGNRVPLQFALHSACHVDCASLLLKAGAKTIDERLVEPGQKDGGGSSCLLLAAYENRLSAMRLLLEHAADINLPRNSGATPLYAAAQEGHAEAVQMLIAFGADIEKVREYSGATP
eukprot:7352238-Prymnesium_polylepis.1